MYKVFFLFINIFFCNFLQAADIAFVSEEIDEIDSLFVYRREIGSIKIINKTNFPIIFQYQKRVGAKLVDIQQVIRGNSTDLLYTHLTEIHHLILYYSTYGQFLQWTSPCWKSILLITYKNKLIDVHISIEETAAKSLQQSLNCLVESINSSLDQEGLTYKTMNFLRNGLNFARSNVPSFLSSRVSQLGNFTSEILSQFRINIIEKDSSEYEPLNVIPGLLRQPQEGQLIDSLPSANKYLALPKIYDIYSLENSFNFLKFIIESTDSFEQNKDTEEKRVLMLLTKRTLEAKYQKLKDDITSTIDEIPVIV